MDSDDVMFSNRIQKQIEFMNNNKDCILSGTQIEMFKIVNGNRQNMGRTSHPNLDLQTKSKIKGFCFTRIIITYIINKLN